MHTPEQMETVELGAEPYILIRLPQRAEGGFDVKVKADGIRDHDELAVLLLLAVENLTGVDSDLYIEQVDALRHAVAAEPGR